MVLRNDYVDEDCTLARALEVVGERWTLLIVRDAFYGVRRFGDFVAHLGIPREVLTHRLNGLVGNGVLTRDGRGRATAYALTAKGRSLWPVVLTLMSWGGEHYAPDGPNRLFVHVADGGAVTGPSWCATCATTVPAEGVEVRPGPGLTPAEPGAPESRVAAALRVPRRLLTPIDDVPG